MDETNLKLLVVLFPDELGVEQGVEILKAAYKDKEGGLQAAMAIVKDSKSALHYKDIGAAPAKSAAGGVVIGAVLGILTGGAGIALGAAGALVGGLWGEKKRAEQFSSVRMNEVVAALAPGSSGIVALVEKAHLLEFEEKFGALDAETFSAELSSDLAEQLEPHRQAIYDHWQD